MGKGPTFWRLAASAHVADLRVIFWSACAVFVLAGATCLYLSFFGGSTVASNAGVAGAIAGTASLVMAWAYQKGSARLGVVDLFSCEIATICRITKIARAAQRYVYLYGNPPDQALRVRAQEHYTPIFDGNSKELQALDARVIEPVTEFYTYQKALLDYLRSLQNLERPHDQERDWREGMCKVIYMFFLMLESGRKAVGELLEPGPDQVQNTIMILLSELVAYGKLLEIYKKAAEFSYTNAALERLQLREAAYRELVPDLYEKADRTKKEWAKAKALTGELNLVYYQVFGTKVDSSASTKLLILTDPHRRGRRRPTIHVFRAAAKSWMLGLRRA